MARDWRAQALRWSLAAGLAGATAIGLIHGHRLARHQAMLTIWNPAWPPLPPGSPAKAITRVQEAYAFAANHPEIVRYMPCYCGCELQKHQSLRDCFVKHQRTNGMPQWDPMGLT